MGERISNLSGGEAKRLQLLTTVIADPEVVILDEPTTGLDPVSREILWNEIRRLRGQGSLILLVTHYLEEMESLADELIFINSGKVHGPFSIPELRKGFGHVVSLTFHDQKVAAAFEQRLSSYRTELQGDTLRINLDNAAGALEFVTHVGNDQAARQAIENFTVTSTNLVTVLDKLEKGERL